MVNNSLTFSNALIIEVFSGTAGLTAELKRLGMTQCFGVDAHVKHAKAHVVRLDLTVESNIDIFFSWLENPLVVGLWFAPPCGTASAARNIPIRMPDGRAPPKVLRTKSHPNGVPYLTGSDFDRVCKANKLYAFTSRAVRYAIDNGIIVAVENPLNSMFWHTTFWNEVSQDLQYYVHHACAYGSQRKKATQVAANSEAFAELTALCPGTHSHLPWGIDPDSTRFATAIETEYPTGLCKAIAQIFAKILIDNHVPPPPRSLQELQEDDSAFMQVARAATQPWSKQSKLPPLVSEHKTIQTITGPRSHLPSMPVRQHLSSDHTFQQITVPAEAQLLRVTPKSLTGEKHGGDSGDDAEDIVQHAYGIPFSKEEFIQQAVIAGHPKSFLKALPKEIECALHDHFNLSRSQLASKRSRWLSRQLEQAVLLKPQEDVLKSSMPQHIQKILAPKRLCLFKQILNEIGYIDVGVVDLLINGGNLVGPIPEGDVFPKHFRPNVHSVEQLMSNASLYRNAVLTSASLTGDEEVDKKLVEKSLDEVQQGWAQGPFDLDDIKEPFILNRRFAVRQKGKIRCVDDYSSSGVNGTCESREKPTLHTVDVVCGILAEYFRMASERGVSSELRGKTLDLKSAYRQLPVSEDHLKFSHFVVPAVGGKKLIFKGLAMPFGSTHSVHFFLRIARALWAIGSSCLSLLWTNFYDDYVLFSPVELVDNSDSTASLLFDLLGWNYDRDGDKCVPFSHMVDALGVRIELTESSNLRAFVSNTPSRIEELTGEIDTILASGKLAKEHALRLRGRLGFAEGQIFGRTCRKTLKLVTEHAYPSSPGISLPSALRAALKNFRHSLLSSGSRKVEWASTRCWYVFTDASFDRDEERARAGIGGVLVDPSGVLLEFFSTSVSPEYLVKLGVLAKQTVIYELELLAGVVALRLWNQFVQDRQTVLYVDNDGARHSYISGVSSDAVVLAILDDFIFFEEASRVSLWVARVPSPSNIADLPSRYSFDFLQSVGCERVPVDESLFPDLDMPCDIVSKC